MDTTPNINKEEDKTYKPKVENDISLESALLTDNITKFKSILNDTLGMVSNSLKDYRNTLTEEEINSESRKERTENENKFFNAMDLINPTIDNICKGLTELVNKFNEKNKEQDEELVELSKPKTTTTTPSVGNTNTSS